MLARDRTPFDARPFRRAKLIIRPAAPTPAASEARYRAEVLARAKLILDGAELAFNDACKWLGEANRRLSRKDRAFGTWHIDLRRAWVRSAFRDINRTRAALRNARAALASLEAA